MKNKEIILHLAELSKLKFSQEEFEKISKDMEGIIALTDKIKHVDSQQEPYTFEAVSYKNLRKDCKAPSMPAEKILKNAVKTEKNTFTVPKIM